MRINSLKEDRKPLLMIIPMIDIIFFLLVFFMMSMLTMVTQKTIALNLPKAAIAKVDTTKTVPVSITEDGRLFLEQNLVSEEELARRLVSLKTENEKLTVVQLVRAERLTAKLRPKDPEWGMGKERLSAAAISLRTVTAPIRHWVPAASRTKSFQRQRQGIRGQLVPLDSTRLYGCG